VPVVADAPPVLPPLPTRLEGLLRGIGEAGGGLSLPTFAVGGFVRDWLLSPQAMERVAFEPYGADLDIVVEGDAQQFARRVHRLLRGRLVLHGEFGTATVTLKKMRIDFASARGETYARPAALPKVFLSSLRDDLFRRDFTINALAVRLNPDSFGALMDFFGGLADLRKRLIRILREGSFIDDPTRIFRAVRFEQRLHFHLEPETERLLRQAVSEGLISCLSPARITEQLRLLFSEADPVSAALRAQKLGVFTALHRKLSLSDYAEGVLQRTPSALLRPRLAHRVLHPTLRWLLFFLPFTIEMSPAQVRKLTQSLTMRREEAEALQEVAKEAGPALDALAALSSPLPSRVWKILHPLSETTVRHLLARCRPEDPQRRLLLDYLTRYRRVALEINGEDLKGAGFAPGPAFGKALERTLKAKLDGLVSGKAEELAFAVRHLRTLAAKER